MNDDEQKSKVEGRKSNPDDHSQASVPSDPSVQYTELQAKCEEYLNGWKRALADYENLKKDIARVTNAEKGRVIMRLTDSMVDIVSNFDLAVRHKPDLEGIQTEKRRAIEQWEVGIFHIQKALKDALSSFSVEGYEPVLGEKFDEHRHEAVGTRRDEKFEPGTIVEVVNLGWKIGDKVIRPARVLVNEN